ncbi:pyrophosphatase PpaX [Metasolibacillus fluoroglycofenilyticus]|uniref:pyrophosphatase PpaX n=1 Tax=Metasolibacillus fluoroglycofenilyticus TaxID=1239396 RepID=UPI000D381562|nr:pyrophosphatase PpaX [Metasolibacillus fluoroglycofenilyticus]
MMVKALLFDFDGTLLNTNELIIQSFMHVLEDKFPGQYSPKDCIKFLGPSLRETFVEIAPDAVDEMIDSYRQWNIQHHDQLVTQYDGVVSTLEELYAQEIRLAIVSTKRSEMIEQGLNVLGVRHLFEHIIGFDHVQHVKPHPEPILLALKKMQLAKEDVIMIGDNSHDIEAGHNAGVKTAGVAWAFKGEEYLQQFSPTYMLQHMTDLLTIVKGQSL